MNTCLAYIDGTIESTVFGSQFQLMADIAGLKTLTFLESSYCRLWAN
jgi:hypothetical protein